MSNFHSDSKFVKFFRGKLGILGPLGGADLHGLMFARLLKGPDVPSAVLKSAPSSLSVYVVSRHNLIIKMAHQPVTTGTHVHTLIN